MAVALKTSKAESTRGIFSMTNTMTEFCRKFNEAIRLPDKERDQEFEKLKGMVPAARMKLKQIQSDEARREKHINELKGQFCAVPITKRSGSPVKWESGKHQKRGEIYPPHPGERD